MIVLGIIGFLLGALLIYLMVLKINEYTIAKFSYEFFNLKNFIISAIGYVLVYMGTSWYHKALKAGDDILNGQILIAVGAILFLYVFYLNYTRTNMLLGIILTSIQLVLYGVLTIGAVFGLIIVLAALSETKPVYVLNK